MATAPETNAYRDRPGGCPRRSCGAGPPESARALGAARPRPQRPEVAPAADSQAGSPSMALAAAAVTPEKRRQEKRRSPWPWKLFSHDLESLMSVRRFAKSVQKQ